MHLRETRLYARVDAIAKEWPTLVDALPIIRALALEERSRAYMLINHYLKVAPPQFFRCQDCSDLVPEHEFARTKCLDCVQADYEEHHT